MTNRKQKIAQTALHLFAERGYENTSTQLIAREADVSEALIFRHFGNKEQLLTYIIKSGYKRIVETNRGLLLQGDDPLQFIYKIIDLPYKLVGEEPEFWKLQSRLLHIDISRQQHERFMQPVHALLMSAFSKLGYERPAMETEFVLLVIEALWKYQTVKSDSRILEMLDFIKTRYRPGTG